MTLDDVGAAQRLAEQSVVALNVATQRADWPAAGPWDDAQRGLWRRRCAHLVEHDGDGCWIAEDDAGLVGIATSLRRESWWGLSGYFVLPRAQGVGVGKPLLDAALRHAAGTDRAMICSSHDPKAVRRYHRAGFTLHPTMVGWGTVDRSAIPVVRGVRDGSDTDHALCDDIDRRTRGAGHGVDHELLRDVYSLIVIDEADHHGYCYLTVDGAPHLLAATDPATATRLLWEALAHSEPDPRLRFVFATADQEWAVDVAIAARLEVHGHGFLAYRGMLPAMPYLPSPHFM